MVKIYHSEGWRGDIRHFLKFQTYYFGHSGCHAKFETHSFTPSRLFLVSGEGGEGEWLIIIATLATAEVSAGAVTKAEQQTNKHCGIKSIEAAHCLKIYFDSSNIQVLFIISSLE